MNNIFYLRISFIILLSICLYKSYAQTDASANSVSKGNIYALVIGISDYSDEKIIDLKYAHRDAERFAEYISSSAGGSVPKENITLLTNSQATISNIYVAKKAFEDKVKKDDLFYFFFSGHGDVESDLYKLGFLLAYDTPHKNYLNNAVRIEDINIMANTLSVNKDVNVILISDACHAGKLTGSDNNRGITLAGDLSEKVAKKEIRIASCEADQKSQEDATWGGGHGVFTYHLINGMKGLADAGTAPDGLVTLQELKLYIEDKVSTDVDKIKNLEQVPVVIGQSKAKMSFVQDEVLEALKNETIQDITALTMSTDKSVDFIKSDLDYYLEGIDHSGLLSHYSFDKWELLNSDQIVDSFLLLHNFINEVPDSKWLKEVKTDPKLRYEFKQKLAAAIHNVVQEDINDYLSGDVQELERRQYYTTNSDFYKGNIDKLSIALKLIDVTNNLYHIIKVKKHYFQGVSYRLKAYNAPNGDSLKTLSLEEQLKAFALEKNAAYILNELGILYSAKKQNDVALDYLKKAIALVPTWAIPVGNLSNLNYTMGEYDKGIVEAKRTIKLQPDFMHGYVNLGLNEMKKNNLLVAAENLLKAEALNNKHYVIAEKLSQIYLAIGDYESADSFQKESIKRNTIQQQLDITMDGVVDHNEVSPDFRFEMLQTEDFTPLRSCFLTTLEPPASEIMANLYLAKRYIDNPGVAETYLRKIIEVNPNDPLAYHYLFKIMFDNKKWIQAEKYYYLYQKNYISNDSFMKYAAKLKETQKFLECEIEETYFDHKYMAKYPEVNTLIELYKNWGYLEKVDSIYQTLMQTDSSNINAFNEWVDFYERQGKYQRIESMIIDFSNKNKSSAYDRLIKFYEKLISKGIDENYYHYKAGLMMYEQAKYKKERFHTFTASDAIRHFEAMSIPATDTLRLTEVNSMLADLYLMNSDQENSKKYLELTAALNPSDAGVKEKLVHMYVDDIEYSKALAELDYLYSNNQITYRDVLLFTEYTILSGNTTKAEMLVDTVDKMFPYYDLELQEIKALNYTLSGKRQEAINVLEKLIITNPKKKKSYYYSIARMKAKMGNIDEAIGYIHKAIEAGFNYAYVIIFDENLVNVKNDSKWKTIEEKMPMVNGVKYKM